jgi:hypothetical protein
MFLDREAAFVDGDDVVADGFGCCAWDVGV